MSGLVPITFETINAQEMIAAIEQAERTGDMGPVWTLVEHLVAQSPGLTRDHVLAVVLFKHAMDAAESGEDVAERTFLQTMREHCSRKAIDQAVLGTLLGSAAKQGWLGATAYDELAERINRLPAGHQARAMFALIHRRREPGNQARPGRSRR
ncbi:MAG: hypothetical protein GEV28_04525 [Actinophytocola sp.]|uniref:hypothetical protein n=1 Tax=Actinophytocola sp. TaxID=1872138 RepID=UPI00132B4676|nr:hypothetical protein [Actinophytocola sp.]MPZ79686.1 hypothetical protein [Actinophytocola sp.]